MPRSVPATDCKDACNACKLFGFDRGLAAQFGKLGIRRIQLRLGRCQIGLCLRQLCLALRRLVLGGAHFGHRLAQCGAQAILRRVIGVQRGEGRGNQDEGDEGTRA